MAEQMTMPPEHLAAHRAALDNALRLARARLRELDIQRNNIALTDTEIEEYLTLQREMARLTTEVALAAQAAQMAAEAAQAAPHREPAPASQPDQAPPAQRYAAVRKAWLLNRQRLAELNAINDTSILREAEIQELNVLTVLVDSQEQALQRLKREVDTQQAQVDIAGVLGRWDTLVGEKCAAYQSLSDSLLAVALAVRDLRAVHVRQEQEVAKLPRAVATKLNFPDEQSAMRNLASRMPVPTAWSMLLGSGAGPISLNQSQLNTLAQNDPGCRAIPERTLRGYVEGVR